VITVRPDLTRLSLVHLVPIYTSGRAKFKMQLQFGVLNSKRACCRTAAVYQYRERCFRGFGGKRQFQGHVEGLSNSGDPNSQCRCIFEAHAVWDFGGMAVFNHGKLCKRAILGVVLQYGQGMSNDLSRVTPTLLAP